MIPLAIAVVIVGGQFLLGPSCDALIPSRTSLPQHFALKRQSRVLWASRTTSNLEEINSKEEDSFNDDATFLFSESSLWHLQNTELPDNYSRPWTRQKVQALGTGLILGGILGVAGEWLVQTFLDLEKTFVLWSGIGIAGGWFLGGGKEVAASEQAINGGFDRKLIADRPARMKSLLESLQKENSNWIAHSTASTTDKVRLERARHQAAKVHTSEYLEALQAKCESTNRPVRLNPTYSRTLIDQYSYEAALQAVAAWMETVDRAVQDDGKASPQFALVRPPSHHACQGKGMGGCLLNSVAIAAHYALEAYPDKVQSVAILDIDAHHGNGIAHCCQNNSKIRYCSIHEDASSGFLGRTKDDPQDPRSGESEDQGPLGNLLNINLPSGTTWESGYKEAFVNKALPFLLHEFEEDNARPDLLLVAAGFDALEADLTSKLRLVPSDFGEISLILHKHFGSRIASGLEGGYCWQGGELNQAVSEYVRSFR